MLAVSQHIARVCIPNHQATELVSVNRIGTHSRSASLLQGFPQMTILRELTRLNERLRRPDHTIPPRIA